MAVPSLPIKSSMSESPDAGMTGCGSEDSNNAASPLHGYGIFSSTTTEKKLKADGTAPKRRGPKPDSKPALNRRQELNRQAQRTHRERKELYIKALEQEVLRLKETYGTVCRDRDAFAEENRKLRELLAQHNIHCPADLVANLRATHTSPNSASSSGSFTGSYDPPSMDEDTTPATDVKDHHHDSLHGNGVHVLPDYNINVDQVGINFVLAYAPLYMCSILLPFPDMPSVFYGSARQSLTCSHLCSLERPCMDHMQMLCANSQNSEELFSGHALMATCPPVNHIIHNPTIQYPHQVSGEVADGDLLKLLDLSARLPLDGGEITPVMAWAYIFRDARFRKLSEDDILSINGDLLAKVRCYGFGAVIEEFEVKDSLENILAYKMETLSLSA